MLEKIMISKSKDFSNGEEVAIEITAKVINDNEKNDPALQEGHRCHRDPGKQQAAIAAMI